MTNDDIRYVATPPSPTMAHLIDAFWESENTSETPLDYPVVPDGCMDIIAFPENSRHRLMVVGAMCRTEIVQTPPKKIFYGIRFLPGVLPKVLKTSARDLVDKQVALESFHPELAQALVSFPSCAHDTPAMEKALAPFLLSTAPDELIRRAIFFIEQSQGALPIAKLAASLGLSERQLERRFVRDIGYPPKLFARIMRFHAAHRRLSRSGIGNLTSLAHEQGYYDQAHFNKEYRRFTGMHPNNAKMSVFYKRSGERPGYTVPKNKETP